MSSYFADSFLVCTQVPSMGAPTADTRWDGVRRMAPESFQSHLFHQPAAKSLPAVNQRLQVPHYLG